MRITSDTVADDVREQLFTIGEIPGVLWTPAAGTGPRPLILVGHGGGQHKKGWEVLSRALPYVQSCGFAVAALDAPGTGDRPEDAEVQRLVAIIREREAVGEPAGPAWPALCETVASQLIPDWQTTLDALQKLDSVGDNQPVGYYGLSQGGEMGIRLAAAEPRITAAVLGLIGSDWLTDAAARITIPVEFVLQWDDEGSPRDSVMKLFDASVRPRRPCTPTRAATIESHHSRSRAPSGSSPGTSALRAVVPDAPRSYHLRTSGR